MEQGYVRGLRAFMRRWWLAPTVLLVAAAASVLLARVLPRELAPLEDRGRLWVRATAPEGTSYESMQRYMDDVSHAVTARVPEAGVTMTQVPSQGGRENGVTGAVNSGFVRVFLKDRDERSRSQQEIVEDLQSLQREFTAARINITQEPSISGNSSNPGVRFIVQGPTLEALREVLPRFLDEAGANPAFTFVDSDLKFTKPEVRVRINRDRAQALGVSAEEVAGTLQSALSGQRVGYFVRDGKQYEVIAQLDRSHRSRPADIEDIPVRTASGEQVRLGNLVSFEESSAPPELYRYNRYSAATVNGTLAKGRTMGEGIEAMEAAARRTLDERFTTSLSGAARDFRESSSALGSVFVLAVVLIFLVLAAQFESFTDPFVILLTVPLALAGALGALWAFGQTLNVFSQIGLIMLVGLVTKNGILIVEFANQRRAATGMPAAMAAREAAAARLRPILMTTLATLLGILPIALALGAGSESRMSMGIAVIGGLACGCLFTLFVIPAMYALLNRRADRG
jgi:multidrug efflux pump